MTAIDNMQDALRRSKQEPIPGNVAAQEEQSQLDQEPYYPSYEDDDDPVSGFQSRAK